MTQLYTNILDPQLIKQLKAGGVGVMPTDTLYGLVAQAANQSATEALYKLKGRSNKPGTLIAASIDQLVQLGIKRRYLTAVEQFWPNSISVVIPTGSALDYIHQGKQTLAVRIPGDTKIHDLLEQTGPLITSSANTPGAEPATTIDEAREYFGDTVDFYVDGGSKRGAEASTIIRIVDDAVEVLREGSVKINEAGRIEA